MDEVPSSPLTPPPRYVYRAYVTSVSESDADQSPLFESSPQLSKMVSPKSILHQKPLMSRSRSRPILDPPSPPAPVADVAGPTVQFGIPSILSPGPTLVGTSPTETAPARPPIQGSRTVPLPQGILSNPVTTTVSAPPLSTPKPIQNPSSNKSTRALHPPTDLPPAKSFRQKAFEKSQTPTPTHDKFGHPRQKASAGQRIKDGAFFAFVILPMSCWYTRGGKMLDPRQKRLEKEHVQIEDDDDMHSIDSRAPRVISPEMKPTKARRMSDDGYRRRSSLSSSNTPKRNMGEAVRRVSFDGRVTVVPHRRDEFERLRSMSRERDAMDWRDEYERTGSMSKGRATIPYGRGSFKEPRERGNTPSRRRSFDGKSSAARERERGYGLVRAGSFESKALVHVPRDHLPSRRDSFEYQRTGSTTRQQQNDDFDHPRTKSMTRQDSSYNNNYGRKVDHDRTGSVTQRGKPQDWAPSQMQMQRHAPPISHRAGPALMSRREWEREQDRRGERASFGGGNNSRIISMGMPPPVMGAERWG